MEKGDKVVCINDKFPSWVPKLYQQLPTKGKVYTIREVCLRRETLRGSESGTIALLLQELLNPPDPTHMEGEELAFRSERFAPLQEKAMEVEEEAEAYAFV